MALDKSEEQQIRGYLKSADDAFGNRDDIAMERYLKLAAEKGAVELTDVENLRRLAFLEGTVNPRQTEVYYRRILELARQVPGKNDSSLILALTNLGERLALNGKKEESLTIAKQALLLAEDKLDMNHDEISEAMIALAQTYIATGNLEEAERLLKVSYAMRATNVFDYTANSVQWVYRDWCLAAGDEVRAEAVRKKAYDYYMVSEPMASDRQMVAFKAHDLGKKHEAVKNFSAAEKAYVKAMELAMDPENHEFYPNQKYEFSVSVFDLLVEQGRTDEAEELIKKRIASFSKPYEEGLDYSVGYLGRYARLLKQLGRMEQSEKTESLAKARRQAEMEWLEQSSELTFV